jgi:ArsR family transcriptional regulator
MMSQRVFEALASPVRRQIVVEVANGELNAGEIAARFELSKPAISQHLSVLEAAGLVTRRKKGQFVYYTGHAAVLREALEALLAQVAPAPEAVTIARAVAEPQPPAPQTLAPQTPAPANAPTHFAPTPIPPARPAPTLMTLPMPGARPAPQASEPAVFSLPIRSARPGPRPAPPPEPPKPAAPAAGLGYRFEAWRSGID